MARGFQLSFDAFKGSFFDRSKIETPVQRMWKRQLSRFGAFVRQRAKTSIRYRKKPSEPGQPPTAHRTSRRKHVNKKTGVVKIRPVSLLREFIFFAYDQPANTVVIGPALLRGVKRQGSQTVPELLEYGGSVVGPRGTMRYEPRPFMRPADAKERPKFLESLKNSVK